MGYRINRKLKFLVVILFFALVGCGGNSYAPVVSVYRTSTAPARGYAVHPGDTLYSIAWAFGMDYRDLARMNGLSQPYHLRVGQHLATTYTHQRPRQRVAKSQPVVHRAYVKPKLVVKSAQPKETVHYVPEPGNVRVGRWLWPARGRIIRKFSAKLGGNRGLDITGRYGSPIRSSAAGLVVYSGSGLRAYGKLIIIKHNASYLSAYAHNRRMLVREGQFVKAGQKIATMGRNNSGKTVLHFEIRHNGRPVNPLRYLHR
ncbi:MAG: peptidoglycan DD-metalloendopeptidase family protein [Gammaproteobacteria bacterium]|nr:peptidoglycan DD-metalloendopeptidase family protein [Gammaproteobacteria bacterium]